MGGGNYTSVYMIGSSKGGTAAIYYGLEFNATAVYAGACQYYIGDYLSRKEFAPIVEGMMGILPNQNVLSELNAIMPNQLKCHSGASTIIHLLYSKDEHTYQEHTLGLLTDLQKYDIPYTERIEHFTEHGDVGKFFSEHLKKVFK